MEDVELPGMSDVSFPDMRRNVILAVRALADKEYQQRVWVDRVYPREGYYDDFSMNVNILYDDTLVLDDPVATLGTVLRSPEEVTAFSDLAAAIDELLLEEGEGKADAEYMASPLWGAVLRSASVAYATVTKDVP